MDLIDPRWRAPKFHLQGVSVKLMSQQGLGATVLLCVLRIGAVSDDSGMSRKVSGEASYLDHDDTVPFLDRQHWGVIVAIAARHSTL
jgi:hypothetical protein